MEKDSSNKTETMVMGFAAGKFLLRNRRYRRNLLFATTLITLIAVFVGATLLGPMLAERPLAFAFFWLVIFLMAAFVLLLAIYDMIRIRQDHKRRMNELENELADAADEARQLAEELKQDHGEG